MSFGLPDSLVDSIKEVFIHYEMIEKVVIYGSRAKSNFKKGSDVDLCIFGPLVETLHLNEIKQKIDDLNSPYFYDISIFSQLDSDELKEHIQRIGKKLYVKPDNPTS